VSWPWPWGVSVTNYWSKAISPRPLQYNIRTHLFQTDVIMTECYVQGEWETCICELIPRAHEMHFYSLCCCFFPLYVKESSYIAHSKKQVHCICFLEAWSFSRVARNESKSFAHTNKWTFKSFSYVQTDVHLASMPTENQTFRHWCAVAGTLIQILYIK
jgi:hypothetical protein